MAEQSAAYRVLLFSGITMTGAAAAWFVTWASIVAATDPPQSNPFWIGATFVALVAFIVGLCLVVVAEVGIAPRHSPKPAASDSAAPGLMGEQVLASVLKQRYSPEEFVQVTELSGRLRDEAEAGGATLDLAFQVRNALLYTIRFMRIDGFPVNNGEFMKNLDGVDTGDRWSEEVKTGEAIGIYPSYRLSPAAVTALRSEPMRLVVGTMHMTLVFAATDPRTGEDFEVRVPAGIGLRVAE